MHPECLSVGDMHPARTVIHVHVHVVNPRGVLKAFLGHFHNNNTHRGLCCGARWLYNV